ncbi:MAG: amidohydrolase family protein [Acidimicrobiia bacterium]|nr:amidohydrolase family protein [Acidimicrobiia bacterium]
METTVTNVVSQAPERVDLLIRSKRILLERFDFDGSVGVVGERIAGLYPRGHEPEAVRHIDATGLVVAPGLIDSHAHFRDPGFTHKEDFAHGTRAAALGGVTTVMDMPNVDPPTNSVETFLAHIENARGKSIVDFGHNAAGTDPSQIRGLAAAGATAFKIFMMQDVGRDYPHMPGTMVEDHGLLYELFGEIASTGLVLMVHPHDQSLWRRFVGDAWERDGRGPGSYAKAWFRDEGLIFNSGVATALELQAATGVPLHLLHTTNARTLSHVRWAKAQGQNVTTELNPHCLFLGGSWENIERLGPYALGVWVSDPHVEALWESVRNGELDIVGTDHAPHAQSEKEGGWDDMFAAPGGSPAIQEFLSLFLTEVNAGRVDLRRVIELCATSPAKRFGLYPHKGVIRVGADADLVLIDLAREVTLSHEMAASKAGYSAYAGQVVKGVPVTMLLRGTVIAEDGRVQVDPGFGQFLGDRFGRQEPKPQTTKGMCDAY